MKSMMVMAAFVFSLFCMTGVAGESHYEVYYFHASWRCTNCTNAEAWTGETVAALQASNPGITIRYAPTQLETNKQLVSLMKAKRVDVAVAEVRDGRVVRHKNLGNILNLVGSKPTLVQHIIDGVVNFSKQSQVAGVLNAPSAGTNTNNQISNRKLAVYIVQASVAGQSQRVSTLISNSISQSFPQLAQNQQVNVSFIDPQARDNAGWLGYVKANPGDVVVAVMGDSGMETFSTLPGPAAQNLESGFINSFANTVRQYTGGL